MAGDVELNFSNYFCELFFCPQNANSDDSCTKSALLTLALTILSLGALPVIVGLCWAGRWAANNLSSCCPEVQKTSSEMQAIAKPVFQEKQQQTKPIDPIQMTTKPPVTSHKSIEPISQPKNQIPISINPIQINIPERDQEPSHFEKTSHKTNNSEITLSAHMQMEPTQSDACFEDKDRPEFYNTRMRASLEKKDFSDVERLYLEASREKQTDSETYIIYIKALLEKKKYFEAERTYNTLRQLKHTTEETYIVIMKAHIENKKYREAKWVCQNAHQDEKDSFEIYNVLLKALIEIKDSVSTDDVYWNANSYMKTNVETYHIRLEELIGRGEYLRAKVVYEDALREKKANAKTFDIYSRCPKVDINVLQKERKEYLAAEKENQKDVRTNCPSANSIIKNLSYNDQMKALLANKEFSATKWVYDEARKEKKDDSETYNLRMIALIENKEFDTTKEVYDDARQENKDDAETYSNRMKALFENKEFSATEMVYKDARQEKKDNSDTYNIRMKAEMSRATDFLKYNHVIREVYNEALQKEKANEETFDICMRHLGDSGENYWYGKTYEDKQNYLNEKKT